MEEVGRGYGYLEANYWRDQGPDVDCRAIEEEYLQP
jgi:hypothetical protein